MKKSKLLLILILSFFYSYSQEQITPLFYNSSYSQNINNISSRSDAVDSVNMPIALPLLDDFSYNSKYPQYIKYSDSIIDTIINHTFLIDELSAGDSNRFLTANMGSYKLLELKRDAVNGIYFSIPASLQLDSLGIDSQITRRYPDVMVFGYRIAQIVVDSILWQDTIWQTDLSPNQTYYDSIVLSNDSLINWFRSDTFFSSYSDVYQHKIDYYESAIFEGNFNYNNQVVNAPNIQGLCLTIELVKTFDTLAYLDVITDTILHNLNTYKLWQDSNVYINRTMGQYPPSIGVATFDGLNAFGVPYSETIDAYGGADTLTSSCINLSSYKPSDSVMLGFYYQAKGYGDMPNQDDLLKLQAKNINGKWETIWTFEEELVFVNDDFNPFYQIIKPIENELYFYKDFQFRFVSIGTLTGAVDHWHLDYVRLYPFGSVVDSHFTDIAISEIPSTLIKQYAQVPWTHYDAELLTPEGYLPISIKSFMKDENVYELNFDITNPEGVKEGLEIGKTVPNTLHNTLTDPVTGNIHLDDEAIKAVNYRPFNSLSKDSASFRIDYIFMPQADTSGNIVFDANRSNDTIVSYQNFYNYYAYDDGSAEQAYGISSPVEGAKLAIGFDILKEDTLRGFYIHWARKSANLENESFQLTIWDSLGLSDISQELILYSDDLNLLAYTDSINAWKYYRLAKGVPVQKRRYYMGWQQISMDKLNVGFDVNTDAHSNVYFNTNGIWQRSSIPGSIMFRPVVGEDVNADGTPAFIAGIDHSCRVYPNPVLNTVNVVVEMPSEIQIYNLHGQILHKIDHSDLNQSIDMSAYPSGIYFLQITNNDRVNQMIKLNKL